MATSEMWKARELEILELIADGLTNSEIAATLFLSPETIRWYNKSVFEKLGVSNRTQAAGRAAELGLLRVDDQPVRPTTSASYPLRSPVKYALNDGVHIAYQVIGEGPVDLLFVHGFLSHLELAWEEPEFVHFFEELGLHARVILFDKRGIGLSDRIQGAPSLDDTINDARVVLDMVGSTRAVVMGTSEGAAAAVLLAATYPERILGLILYGATPKLIREDGEQAWGTTHEALDRQIASMKSSWGQPWALGSFAPSRQHDEAFRTWWAKILRAAASPSSVEAVINTLRDIDVRGLLPQIRLRTLVIHKTGDTLVKVEAGRYLAAQIPNATILELPGADHIYFVDAKAILTAVVRFIKDSVNARPVDTWLAVVLVAAWDGNGVTEAELQNTLAHFRPRQVVYSDHGLTALFDSPPRAIQCAVALCGRYGSQGMRVGVHVGECNLLDGSVAESVMMDTLAATKQAEPGEIVLTRTIRDILAGTGWLLIEKPSSDTFGRSGAFFSLTQATNPELG